MYRLPHSGAAAHVQPIVGPFAGDPEVRRAILTGAHDTQVSQDQPDTSFESAATLRVRGGAGGTQALVRFDNVFGIGAAQVPPNASILSAKLTLWTTGSGSTQSPVAVHRMKWGWNERDTWNDVGGLTPAVLPAADFVFAPPENAHPFFFDVSETVRTWQRGESPDWNYGWAILGTAGTDAWEFVSSENANAAQRPSLEVAYAFNPTWNPTISNSWEEPANWQHGLPNEPRAVAYFGSLAGDGPRRVDFATDKTVGTLIFERGQGYILQGADDAKLFLDNGGQPAMVETRIGRHAVRAPVVFVDSAVIEMGNFAITFGGGATLGPGKTLTQGGSPTAILEFYGGLELGEGSRVDVPRGYLTADQITGRGELNVGAGGAVQLTGDPSQLSRLTALALAGEPGNWRASLDIGRSGVIIDYGPGESPLATVVDQIGHARATGWAGNGIASAGVRSTPGTGIGYVDVPGADGGVLTVRFTLLGDANLDGLVDLSDLAILAQHYNTTDGTAFWWEGDFNYDHNVTFGDLALMAQNYNRALPDFAAALAQVPEPSVLFLGVFTALGLRNRRRRSVVLSPAAG
jgi:hypothetical protein